MVKRKIKRTSKTGLLVRMSAIAVLGLHGRPAAAQSINCNIPLLFGNIVPCSAANTVVVTPSDTRTVNGCLTGGGAPFSRARCFVSQSNPFPVQVSIPAATYTLTAGANTMQINNLNMGTSGGSTFGRTLTYTDVFFTIPIGATLNVGANQPTGSYTGSFTVIANFN